LIDCVSVSKCKIYDESTFQAEYQNVYGKAYRTDIKEEEIEMPPMMIYERDPRSGFFKVNLQKSIIPRSALSQLPDEFYRFSQADRDKFMHNMALE